MFTMKCFCASDVLRNDIIYLTLLVSMSCAIILSIPLCYLMSCAIILSIPHC